ncbi:MAG: DMT family transporter [Candidatus Delongbacteria bacterium]|nr:DMT family transporter [Candidatus Delongbacteria bacterium]
MKDQKRAYIFALIAVFFWSTVAVAFKLTLAALHHDQIQMLFLASVSSLFILFTAIIFQKKLHLFKSLTFKDYLFSAFLGSLNPFFYYLILFKAYDLLPAQEAQPLNFTWSIMLVLLSIPILKQKISWKSFAAILISFFGVYVISSHGDITSFKFSNPLGVALALSTATIWALFWIYNAKDDKDEAVRLFLNFLFGSVYITVTVLIFSDISSISFKGLIGGTYIGFFEMGLTFLLWSKALKLSVTTAKVSNLIFLAPFLSLVLIHFIVPNEDVLLSTFVGLIFIVAGILLQRKLK